MQPLDSLSERHESQWSGHVPGSTETKSGRVYLVGLPPTGIPWAALALNCASRRALAEGAGRSFGTVPAQARAAEVFSSFPPLRAGQVAETQLEMSGRQ